MNFLNNRWILLALAALALTACKERDTHYEYFDDAKNKPRYVFEIDKETGKKDGTYKEFWQNGNLKIEGSFSEGMRNGTFREYQDDGSILLENNYKNDVVEGTVKVYNREKKLISKGEISDGSYVHQNFFTDSRDGKKYPVVAIGSRIWMAANLNFYTSGSLCYADKDEYCDKYGRLYTWHDAAEICPDGWDLPNYAEIQNLVEIAGGDNFAARLLKDPSEWRSKSWQGKGSGIDALGFSALPAGSAGLDFLQGKISFEGLLFGDDAADNAVRSANFWLATEYEYEEAKAYNMALMPYDDGSSISTWDKRRWHSVRCIKDVD